MPEEKSQDNVFQGKQTGPPDTNAGISLLFKRGIEDIVRLVNKIELGVVQSYDFDNQRADVRLKNRDEVQSFKDVPIVGGPSGSNSSVYIVMPLEQGDVGFLCFPDTDSRSSYQDEKVGDDSPQSKQPRTSMRHKALGPFFVPWGPLLGKNSLDDTIFDKDAGSDVRKAGPKDLAINYQGSAIIIKENGAVSVETADKFYYNGEEVATTDLL